MDLRIYFNPIRRWWWLILAATILAVGSSYFYASQQPPVYQARIRLQVGNVTASFNPNPQQIALAQQLAGTYAGMVNLESVRTPVQESLGLGRLPEIRSYVLPQTPIVEILVIDTVPQRAQAVANEIGSQLIRQSPGGTEAPAGTQGFVQDQLARLEQGILATTAEIEKKQEELTAALSASRIAGLQNEIAALENKLTAFQANHAAYIANTDRGAVNTLQVLEAAVLPTRPANFGRVPKILVLAAGVGFALAIAAVYAMEYLEDAFRFREDVESSLELPVLAELPVYRPFAQVGRISVLEPVPVPVAESYRELSANLLALPQWPAINTLMVTSPGPGEGKTTVVTRLGCALAELGQRVLLIDGDLHRSRLSDLFGASIPPGDVPTFRNGMGWQQALIEGPVPGLFLLPAGDLHRTSRDSIPALQLRDLLARVKPDFDLVIVDSPPVNAVTDPITLSPFTDGVLLVLEAGRSRRDESRRALKRLRTVHAPLLGVVLNKVPLRSVDYHRYGYTRKPRGVALPGLGARL